MLLQKNQVKNDIILKPILFLKISVRIGKIHGHKLMKYSGLKFPLIIINKLLKVKIRETEISNKLIAYEISRGSTKSASCFWASIFKAYSF